jgi:hypothetical protein
MAFRVAERTLLPDRDRNRARIRKHQYTLLTDVYWFNMHDMDTDVLNDQLNKWKLQLRKGVLLHMTLSLLNKEEMYGYALISFCRKK